MKKRKYIRIIVIVVIFAALFIKLADEYGLFESELYKRHKVPYEEILGKESYSEIDYKCTDYESEVGNMLIEKVRAVAEYTGKKEDAEYVEEIGELNKFYYFHYAGAVTQDVTLTFITCKIEGDNGRVWVEYSRKCYDENGQVCNSCSRWLMIWYIEKVDDVWTIVSNKEVP